MTEDFFDFIKAPSKEQFLKSQCYVLEHKNYDPYTRELDDLMNFMDGKEFQKVIDFKSINTLLSPSAHLLKHHAAKEIKDDLNAQSEWLLFHKIMENLLLTGDGSKEQPYLVTQISDERDIIQSLEEQVDRQALMKDGGKSYDKISTKSGKTLYFDITPCMAALSEKFSTKVVQENNEMNGQKPSGAPAKKWWKFW